MHARDSRSLFPLALAGFAFLAVALGGLAVAVAGVASGTLLGAGVGIVGALTGVAGYVLAREHSKTVLEREGLVAEIEQEVQRLDEAVRRLTDAHGRTADRVRLEGETIKEFVKEERSAVDLVAKRTERQKEALEALEQRVGEVELVVGRKPSVRVEVSR